jgi:16S rRNA (guanine1207-N2)-methyltransferase
MNDPSIVELIKHLPEMTGPGLWIADENHHAALPLLRPYANELSLISNRYDLAQHAQTLGLNCAFSDWRFAEGKNYRHIYLRICKEKPVNLHLLRQAFLHLEKNGCLIISGEKNDGIKSFWQEATEIFQQRPPLEKQGLAYVAQFCKSGEHKLPPYNNYQQLQMIGTWAERPIYSKPGVYGWDKIDQGSKLLIEQLPFAIREKSEFDGILDLGCGYGFLTLASAHLTAKRRVATDNNAAAMECIARNAEELNLVVTLIAGDCGDTVTGTFDLILCNPPFHRGFDVDGDLTRRFLTAARDKLAPGGSAMFVVNSFIPIEKKLRGLFRETITLVNNKQFKVLRLNR